MKTFLILFILSAVVQFGSAQTLKTYRGLYEGGQATYTYYENENGERVKHGKFTFNKHDSNFGFSYKVSGSYKNNMKDGQWTYNLKGLEISKIVINFTDGDMNGPISRTYYSRDGKVRRTECYQMKNYRVTGIVKDAEEKSLFNSVPWTLTGQFDDDGYPDGIWTKNYITDGNIFIDTEKYIHGILIAKQTKNESTGEILKYKFNIDPQKFIHAYNPDKDSTIVDGNICELRIRFTEGEENYDYGKSPNSTQEFAFASREEKDWKRLPDVFGAHIRGFAFEGKGEKGYASGQNTYEGIPYKEIAIVGKIEPEPGPMDGRIYTFVEQMPQFPGGDDAVEKYLNDELKYPTAAAQQGIQGRVIVQFAINRDGSISDAKIVRSIDEACDKEALRLVNNMPKWIPGKQNNKNVRVWYTLAVTFSLKR